MAVRSLARRLPLLFLGPRALSLVVLRHDVSPSMSSARLPCSRGGWPVRPHRCLLSRNAAFLAVMATLASLEVPPAPASESTLVGRFRAPPEPAFALVPLVLLGSLAGALLWPLPAPSYLRRPFWSSSWPWPAPDSFWPFPAPNGGDVLLHLNAAATTNFGFCGAP